MTNLLANSRAALAATDHRAPQQGAAAVRPNAVLAEPGRSGAPASRFSEAQWRNLLLGGVAAGVAFFGYGRMAYADPLNPNCSTSGTTITCTGDLSAGVAVANPATALNVNSLTTDITPAAGVHGIGFTSTGDITIVSDTGAFAISVSGAGAYGIKAYSSGAAVSVMHTGDITSENGRGIDAVSTGGSVTTVSTGKIQANKVGIHARSWGGAVNVTHTGDVTSDFIGIYAWSLTDNITIVSMGNIHGETAGIKAKSTGAGAMSVTHTGDITAYGGISVSSEGGSVTTLTTGNIQAVGDGILAATSGAGAVSVTHMGDISSGNGKGIVALSSSGSGSVTTVSTGTIQANLAGISAASRGTGAVSVTHTGDITSNTDRGILAYSKTGSATTVSEGTMQANLAGIEAKSLGAGAVSVTHTGDITSDASHGIYAYSKAGSVTTVSAGNIHSGITVYTSGIVARNLGAGAVSVTHSGDITSDGHFGIGAVSTGGGVTTLSTGNINGKLAGILARDYASGAVSVTHTGDISVEAGLGIAAVSDGDGSVTTLSTGNIQAINYGIVAYSKGAGAVSITHTGDVSVASGYGITAYSIDGSVRITLDDGVVRGLAGAIQATSATGTTLNLNAGSVLIGEINLDSVLAGPTTTDGAGGAVLNTGPGLSIAHTFTGTVPTIGNTSGNVSAVSGNQIAVADISGLTAADNQLSDTLDGVSGVLGTAHARGKGQWWISGFGGTGNVDASSSAPKADHSFGGFVAGGHTVLGNGMQLGVFGGLSKSVHQASVTNGVRAESSGFFGGLYGGYAAEAFALDFALTAGSSSNDGTRIVANNMVATGLETATSSYDSFFIAPELTLSSKPMAIGSVGFTPSLRVRYELMKSDGFAETGLTSGALTMGSATSHALNMRLQGAFPVAFDDPASKSALIFRTGIDARFASYGGRQATLLGVVSNDAGADNESSGGGFAGLDFTHALSDAAMLTANGELRAGTNGLSATANFGIRVQF